MLPRDDHRHTAMDQLDGGGRLAGEDSEMRQGAAFFLPIAAGEEHEAGVGGVGGIGGAEDEVRVGGGVGGAGDAGAGGAAGKAENMLYFFGAAFLPLVVTAGRDQTSPLQHGFLEHGFFEGGLAAGIDHRFAVKADKSPLHGLVLVHSCLDRHDVGGKNVAAGLEAECDLLRYTFSLFFYFPGNILQLFFADFDEVSTAHSLLPL